MDIIEKLVKEVDKIIDKIFTAEFVASSKVGVDKTARAQYFVYEVGALMFLGSH